MKLAAVPMECGALSGSRDDDDRLKALDGIDKAEVEPVGLLSSGNSSDNLTYLLPAKRRSQQCAMWGDHREIHGRLWQPQLKSRN